jgi:hypothetical protein
MSRDKLEQVRVQNEAMQRFMRYTLKEWHKEHGDDAWIPIPDLAALVGMSPDATERLIKELLPEQDLMIESCRALGFTEDRYRRGGPDKGYWTAVKQIPPEVAEKRRKAAAEYAAKLDRAAFLVNEALREKFGERLSFHAVSRQDGRILVVPVNEEEDESKAVEEILKLDPAKKVATPLPARRTGR